MMFEVSERFVEKMTLMDKIGTILHRDNKTFVAPLFPVVYIRRKLVRDFGSTYTDSYLCRASGSQIKILII